MTREAFLRFCAGLEGVVLDRPFRDDLDTTVARHQRSKKWFALVLTHEGRVFANLKCEPVNGGLMRSMFPGIRPGWHMNKDHWISVDLDGSVPETVVRRLAEDSHALTAPKLRRVKAKDGMEP